MSNISDVIGFEPTSGLLIAEDHDENLLSADPAMVPELRKSTFDELHPEVYAKRSCVFATIHHQSLDWKPFRAFNAFPFKQSLKVVNRQRYGFPYWQRFNPDSPMTGGDDPDNANDDDDQFDDMSARITKQVIENLKRKIRPTK